ncbi:radical SAM protein [Candidatus Bathyarchaeota archaeon]|nr:radical SAM protein [Candidatus Bathyarchaeota archaeon]
MVNKILVKSVLNKHRRRDDWFLDDYSVNPYFGCSFNCIYCYVRGSKYGANMAKNLSVKVNAPEILERQLSRRAERGEYGIVALSSSTEPYMPIEEKLKMTRRILEKILKYRFPVEVLTKSKLVLRDLDLLRKIDEKAILPSDLKSKLKHGTIISFSISTLNEKLAKILEPGAPKPIERLKTMKICKEEGFFTGVCFIPVLPYLSDSKEQLEKAIKTAKEFGADFVFIGGLTLFGNDPADCRTLYYKFLEKHYPELVSKYRRLYRNFSAPSKRYQKELEKKSEKLCRKYGIKRGIA